MESQVGPPKHHIPERTTSHLSQLALTELCLPESRLPSLQERQERDRPGLRSPLCRDRPSPPPPPIMIPLLKFLLSSTFQPRLTAPLYHYVPTIFLELLEPSISPVSQIDRQTDSVCMHVCILQC